MNTRARITAGLLVLLSAVALAGRPAAATDGLGVPWFHQQLHDDCEAAALRMVLAGRGLAVSDLDVLARVGIDLAHAEFGHSGARSGDPYRTFVGDPDGSERHGTGYGVYAPPIAAAARAFGLTVLASGRGIGTGLLARLVGAGHPAVVWVDYLWRSRPVRWYQAYDGNWVPYAGAGEHAIAVTGFHAGQVQVDDPARGHYLISATAFAAGYAAYGDMAVVVR
ncbi:hypothetical protein GXW82_17775 [Streptacidiphilus sp. 4-A2]|nr:hypothetical protein [Streptacidiphilus sp. 4-A2]